MIQDIFKQIINKPTTSLGMLAITIMSLTACSAAKDDYTVANAGSGALNSCKSDCVNIEFTNEPTENLNYSCKDVNNVTGKNSQAQCPNNSELKFFIQAKDGNHKIEIGSTKVTALNSQATNTYILRKTPLALVARSNVTTKDSASVTTAANIIRFLDALRVENKKQGSTFTHIPFNKYAPVNLIKIEDDIKANMDEYLTEDVTLTDFSTDAFITKTQSWLDSHGLAVTMTNLEAKKQLENILKTDFSSVYLQPSLAISKSLLNNKDAGFNTFLNGIGIYGNELITNNVVNMTVYGLTTRDGGHIGQGLYWTEDKDNQADNTQQQYTVFYSVPFKKMHKIEPQKTSFNLYDLTVDDFKWQIYNDENGTTTPQDIIKFNQGRFLRNFAIIGNQSLKNSYIGDGTVSDDVLGRWQQHSDRDESDLIAQGDSTITKIQQTAVSTLFDPQVWRSEHVVNVGDRYVFPLHAVLDFKYGTSDTAFCGANGCSFGKGKLGITILESGDIITDGSNDIANGYVLGKPDCKATDSNEGVLTANGFNEKRIGTVRATMQQIKNKTGSFFNPSIMLSGNEFKELDGIQIGTRAVLQNLVTIDVESLNVAASSDNGNTATIDIYDVVKDTDTVEFKNAKWANIYNSYDSIRILNDDNTTETSEDKQIIRKAEGSVSLSLSDCYSIKTRL